MSEGLTDTPRVDAKVEHPLGTPGVLYVPAEFARQLERELGAMREALHHIAITDDADCKHANDPKALIAIARAALQEKP